MPFTARPLLFLAGSLAFTATQISAASQALLQSGPQSRNCPVTVYAQPRFAGGVTLVVPDQSTGRDRAGVHLLLQDPDGRALLSAEVTLRGRAVSYGAQPASLGGSTQPTKSFHVVSGGSAPGSLTADLWLARAASIESVSVTAVAYASAPAWHTSPASSCVAVPDGNRLVGSLR